MNDLGTEAISSIYTNLMIDDQWATKGHRTFSWIGDRLEQNVSASNPIDDDGIVLSRLVAECRVVEAVAAPEDAVLAILSEANRHSFGSCYTYIPAERAIVATTSVWIHEQTASWRTWVFTRYVIGQLIVAEAEADYLAGKCDGRVATRKHPISGIREQRDDMLGGITDILAPQGLLRSKFVNRDDFESASSFATKLQGASTLGASETGVALEMPFADVTSIAILRADAKHRLLGSGLLGILQIPNLISPDEGYRIAAMLNRREREDGPIVPHLGAWCVDGTPRGDIAVSYRFFIPNALYLKDLTLDAAITCNTRVRWADRVLNTKASPGNAWIRMASRFGLSSEKSK